MARLRASPPCDTRRYQFMQLKPEFWKSVAKQPRQTAEHLATFATVQASLTVCVRDLSRRVGVLKAAAFEPSLWSRLRARFTRDAKR